MRGGLRKAGLVFVAASALVAAVCCVAVVPAQAAPGPRFGENYLLPPLSTARGRDVPGLAVNPANPNHIVEAEIDPINLECNYNVSFDGGRTWSGGRLRNRIGGEDPPFPTPACEQNFDAGGYAHFNTGIVFGSNENVYITFSVHRGEPNRLDTSPPLEGGAGDDVMVARSTDGGRTFEPALRAIAGAPRGQPVATRPQIAVQRGAGTAGLDRLYVNAWELHITAGGGPRRMLTARSDDAGATWTPAVVGSARNVRNAADATTVGTPDEIVRELSQPVVGPDGAVYAAYRSVDRLAGVTCPPNPVIQTNCIVVAKSTDLGQTWTHRSTNVPLSGSTGQPRLAIDPATPAGTGTLYVAYYKPVGSDPDDIQLQRSTDGGQTWSTVVRPNDDPAGAVQSFPQVAVGPGGRVNVTWFDRRHGYPGPGGTRIGDIYFASSTDGGATFGPNRRVTDRSINRDTGIDSQLGSYSFYGPVSLPLSDGSVLAAFMDSRTGNVDNGIQDIFLSRLSPGGEVGSSSVATASPAGLSVRLSRLAYPGGGEALSGDPATRVVVVGEGDVAGALAGAVLARANLGPLLVSAAGGLPAVVRDEAARLRPVGAFVLGDTSSLSTGVSGDLRDVTRGGENVSRIGAASNVTIANRPADVARQIAELLRPLPGGANPEAVIVNPATPEAASAAALAAALRLPMLFVDARTTAPPPTTAAISSLGIKKVLIVGNTTSVNPGVQGQLNTLLGEANVRRLDGADASATSEAVLTEARTRGLPANVVYVADATRPLDAGVLAAAVARLSGLMLLTPAASSATAQTRLTALGVEPLVDRGVSAIGTGGSDPAPPAPPAQSPAQPASDAPAAVVTPQPAAAGAATPATARRRGRLSARVTPARDLRAPYRFTITGRLTLPRGISRAVGCRGPVSVTIKRGGTTISSRRVFVQRRDCTYRSTVTFATARRFGMTIPQLRITARFLGNARIAPATAPTRFPHIRR